MVQQFVNLAASLLGISSPHPQEPLQEVADGGGCYGVLSNKADWGWKK